MYGNTKARNVPDYLNALENMHYDFFHYREYIRGAHSSKKIRLCLNTIHNYKTKPTIPKRIKNQLNKIKRKVRAIYTYDYTRKQLDGDLNKIVELLEDAIRTENPWWQSISPEE